MGEFFCALLVRNKREPICTMHFLRKSLDNRNRRTNDIAQKNEGKCKASLTAFVSLDARKIY